MARSRKRYRNYTSYKPSDAVGLQYELLLDLIEREGVTLARRSDNVLRKISDTLEENWREARSFLNVVEGDSPLVQPALQLVLAEQEFNRLQEEVNRQYRSKPWPWRIIDSGVSAELRQQLKTAEANWREARGHWQLQQSRHARYGVTTKSKRFSNVTEAQMFIARADSARIVLHEAMLGETRRAEMERRERDRAHAQAFRDEIRAGAGAIRKTLPRNHPCPYCGGPLGSDAQADHIHPVSQGGQNLVNNMVFACYRCNQAKHDKTLREFIQQDGLDRNAVEQRLLALGKRI